MELNNGSLIWIGTEGTVARYRLTLDLAASLPAHVRKAAGLGDKPEISFDVLVEEAGDEHPMIAVRNGETSGGIVTNGRARLMWEAVDCGGESYATDEGFSIPDNITWRTDTTSVFSYFGPRFARFAKELDLV